MAYTMSGTYAAACSCLEVCPCPMDGTPVDPNGKGECRGYALFQIREGSLDDTDLGGVSFALYNFFPQHLSAGNWKVGIVVDDAASDEQAQAIEKILSGSEGGVFGDLAALIGEYSGMDRQPITMSDGDTPSVKIGSRAEYSMEPYRGVDGNPVTVKNAPFGFAPEFRIGKATGRGDAYGGFDASYAEHADFMFSSEGQPEVRGRA
jgi:hypothetical protein